jgi:glycosyltransferase involved in cell wall biosynthesis
MKPRVLMVARTRYGLPLPPGRERKFAALRERFDLRVLATSAAGRPSDDGVFHLVGRLPLDGLAFWVLLPWRSRRLARAHRADVLLAQSPYEAALAGGAPRLIVEVHGDWRTFTRLYGSPWRRLLAPVADAVARRGLRRADAVRTISGYTSRLVRELGVEPDAEFPTFFDLDAFVDSPPAPLPERPSALFVGVLELYKNVDGLARVWRRVAPRVPEAHLRIVGRGPRQEVIEALVRDLPGQVAWVERLEPAEVAAALDNATCLMLPSRSEGLGRVLLEAFLRGRPAVAMNVGGIRDAVEDGTGGLLADDEAQLEEALVRVLTDRELAERLAAGAQEASQRWQATPEQYADSLARLVEKVCG